VGVSFDQLRVCGKGLLPCDLDPAEPGGVRYYPGIQVLSVLHGRLLRKAKREAKPTSHTVATFHGRTKIPLATGEAQTDDTILKISISCHG